jgi:hypothetical protein
MSYSSVDNLQLINCCLNGRTRTLLSKLPRNLKVLKVEMDFNKVGQPDSQQGRALPFDMTDLIGALQPAMHTLESLVVAAKSGGPVPVVFVSLPPPGSLNLYRFTQLKRLSVMKEWMLEVSWTPYAFLPQNLEEIQVLYDMINDDFNMAAEGWLYDLFRLKQDTMRRLRLIVLIADCFCRFCRRRERIGETVNDDAGVQGGSNQVRPVTDQGSRYEKSNSCRRRPNVYQRPNAMSALAEYVGQGRD